MKMKLMTLIFTLLCSIGISQDLESETYELVNTFEDVISLIVSEDNTTIALISGNHKLAIFDLNSLELIRRVKVTRKTWLAKAFFENDHQSLFFDYGTQLNFKYKQLDIETGRVNKVECNDISKGCDYIAVKICDIDNQLLVIKRGEFKFEFDGIDINMFQAR